MAERDFRELIEARWKQGKFICVGLDSDFERLPIAVKSVNGAQKAISLFNKEIVNATKDLVCAFKPNIAFYEAYGAEGFQALAQTVEHIRNVAPEIPIILDAKRADIDITNKGYARMAFEHFEADAVTVHPYLGREALKPFLDRAEKGIFVLCRNSNSGAGEFQDLLVMPTQKTLYQYVADQVTHEWNQNGNCALVVGATYPHELAEVRKIAGKMPILVPGVGAQGGDIEAIVKAGMNSDSSGMVINSSREIIFASSGEDFAQAARQKTLMLHNRVNQFRPKTVSV